MASIREMSEQLWNGVMDADAAHPVHARFPEGEELLFASAQDARRLADVRYRGGAASYLEVLDADTRLFAAELGLAQAQLSELGELVEIYRALGGGWQP